MLLNTTVFDEFQFLMYQNYICIFSFIWGSETTYFTKTLIYERSYTQFQGNLTGSLIEFNLYYGKVMPVNIGSM